jgi:hypothetical protein
LDAANGVYCQQQGAAWHGIGNDFGTAKCLCQAEVLVFHAAVTLQAYQKPQSSWQAAAAVAAAAEMHDRRHM